MTFPALRSCFLVTLLGCLGLSAMAADAPKVEPPTALINKQLAEKWKAEKLTPAERTSDHEFIRRATLDIIGRIATVDEVRAFEKDTAADKRAKLVERLLASDEYARNWADVWTAALLARNVHSAYQDQLRTWLQQQFAKNVSYKGLVEKLLTASGKTTENGAVNFILAQVGAPLKDSAKDGQFDMEPITNRTLRVFLGYRVEGSNIADHPLHPDFPQEKFWGVNAFFRQVERKGTPGSLVESAVVLELLDNGDFNKKGAISYDKRDGNTLTTEPTSLDGRKPARDSKGTRREALASLLTTEKNFAPAYVNRMWGHFFGRGLQERPSVDEFSSQHKVVHPEVLEGLAKAFADGGYDSKKLIRWICASDAYQLKSTSNATNGKPEAEVYFSRMPLKVMTQEQLFESLLAATQVKEGQTAEGKKQLRAEVLKVSPRRFAENDEDQPFVRIMQNAALLNRKVFNEAIQNKDTGTMAKALAAKSSDKALEELYLATLNRLPTAKESAQIQTEIEKEQKQSGGKDLTPLWQDLFWALLNSSEFILNH